MQKVACITGGSHGIGRGIAIALGKAGYAVAFTYYENEYEAIEVQNTLSTLGVRSAYYQAKMENITAAEQLISNVRNEFGRIDAMICNGAMDRRMSILTVTPEQIQFMTTQLYMSQMLCASRAAQWMVKDRIAGSILFTSSIRAQRADTSDFLYGGMKAALERSCQSLALELAPYGIRVNCIAPGSIDTSGNREAPPCDRVPLGLMGRTADIGAAAAFLISDQAAYITGTVLRVDGGLSLPGQPEGWGVACPINRGFVERSYQAMLQEEAENHG